MGIVFGNQAIAHERISGPIKIAKLLQKFRIFFLHFFKLFLNFMVLEYESNINPKENERRIS
jgi:hypothetical protein